MSLAVRIQISRRSFLSIRPDIDFMRWQQNKVGRFESKYGEGENGSMIDPGDLDFNHPNREQTLVVDVNTECNSPQEPAAALLAGLLNYSVTI